MFAYYKNFCILLVKVVDSNDNQNNKIMTQYEAAIYGIDVSEYDQETDYIKETNGIDEIVNINENEEVENDNVY